MLKIKFPFKTTAGWAQDFKKKTKNQTETPDEYISSKDNATFEEKVKSC
jgi:hypothetical protein